MIIESFNTVWSQLAVWQKIVASSFFILWIGLTIYGVKTNKIDLSDDGKIIDTSVFSKDRLKLFLVAGLLLLAVFGGIPYFFF